MVSLLNEVSSFQGCPYRGVPLYSENMYKCMTHAHIMLSTASALYRIGKDHQTRSAVLGLCALSKALVLFEHPVL